jgi:hypothetical protein
VLLAREHFMTATGKEKKPAAKGSHRGSERSRKAMLYVGLAVAVITLGVMVRRTLGED